MLADVGATVIVVAVKAGTHGGRGGSKPAGIAGQTQTVVGASVASVVTGLALLVHSVIVVPNATNAVLVDGVEESHLGAVTGLALVDG